MSQELLLCIQDDKVPFLVSGDVRLKSFSFHFAKVTLFKNDSSSKEQSLETTGELPHVT